MKRSRVCLFHIGTHKTGTTSIQYALSQAAPQLAEAGFVFPKEGRLDDGSGHHRVALQLYGSPLAQGDDSVAALLAELASSDMNAIISSEEFTKALYLNPEGFQLFVNRLREMFSDITVVLYLRKQTGFILSNYLQRLRSGFWITFRDYAWQRLHQDLDEYPLDYAILTSALERLHGVRLIVRSYEVAARNGAVRDFTSLFDPSGRLGIAESRRNESSNLIEDLRFFYQNRTGAALDAEEAFMIELIGSALGSKRLVMHDATRSMIVDRFAASNEALAQRWTIPDLIDTQTPPPDDTTIIADELFSNAFGMMIDVLAQRFASECRAREQAQRLAVARYHEIRQLEGQLEQSLHSAESERARLGSLQAALDETQALAWDRQAQINRLQAALTEAQILVRSAGVDRDDR